MAILAYKKINQFKIYKIITPRTEVKSDILQTSLQTVADEKTLESCNLETLRTLFSMFCFFYAFYPSKARLLNASH